MILFRSEQVGDVLQRLYDSEINIELSSFWDSGYTWRLGDPANGYREPIWAGIDREVMRSSSLLNNIDGLAFQVVLAYPESEFAEWYNSLKNIPIMNVYVTEIKAIDPTTGEMLVWAGPNVPGDSFEAAEKYCQENGLGYCKVVGQLA